MSTSQKRIALVTGANRGLGLEVCRRLAGEGLHVILTSRDRTGGKEAADRLRAHGLDVSYQKLDVASMEDIESVHESVVTKHDRLDVLVNNAAILVDRGWPVVDENLGEASSFKTEMETLRRSVETNTFGPFRMCQLFIPLMIRNGYGRVVNLSTGMSRLAGMGGGWAGYRVSKAALNAVTRLFAAETGGTNVLVNAADPGWVRTRMGGSGASLSVEEGADTIVWLATLPDGAPSGQFFLRRQAVDW